MIFNKAIIVKIRLSIKLNIDVVLSYYNNYITIIDVKYIEHNYKVIL